MLSGLLLASTAAHGQVTVSSVNFHIEGLSADGRVAVGRDSARRPVFWRNGITTSMGLPPGLINAEAVAVSGDGAVIAGNGYPAAIGTYRPMRPWVWTANTGFTMITIPGYDAGQVSCISRDGRVIGGAFSASVGYRGFVWTREEGGRIPPLGSNHASWIHALSPDGNTAVGSGSSSVGQWGMLWHSTHLWCNSLGSVPDEIGGSAVAMNPDASVIVGHSNYDYATVWTQSTGLETFGSPVLRMPELRCVSDDGRIAGGDHFVRSWYWEGLIWRSGYGLIDSHTYLTARGVPAEAARHRVVGLSASGRVFALTANGSSIYYGVIVNLGPCGSADFDHDGDTGTDQDIEAFFACLAGTCCPLCDSADFNYDGDTGTDQDIEAFFRVLAGHSC
jgi:uncharacterized membrane protein